MDTKMIPSTGTELRTLHLRGVQGIESLKILIAVF